MAIKATVYCIHNNNDTTIQKFQSIMSCVSKYFHFFYLEARFRFGFGSLDGSIFCIQTTCNVAMT